MGLNIKWDITYKCNLNCGHCINGKLLGNLEDEADTENIKEIIKKLSEAGVDRVHLLGGEPTARVDFLEILDCLEENNIVFGFNTNGLKLSNADMRKAIMNNSYLRNIVISLEGPTRELNDLIRGKRVFDITKKNLEELVLLKRELGREDVTLTVNTVVSKINISYIPDMINFCISEGVNQLVLLQLIPEGNAKEENLEPDASEILDLVKTIAQMYPVVKDKLTITPRFITPLAKKYSEVVLGRDFPEVTQMCGAGCDFFYINNKGELFPCDRYKDRIQELNYDKDLKVHHSSVWDIANYDGFSDIFRMSDGEEAYSNKDTCKKCSSFRKTCYPCVLSSRGDDILCKKMMEDIERCIG